MRLNHGENGSGKPRIRALAKGATFRPWDFETGAFNRSATLPRGNRKATVAGSDIVAGVAREEGL
jgi:hypothetical protein